VTEIGEHIDEALADIGPRSSSDAEVRNVLERLGEPEEIAAEAAERFGIAPVRRRASDVGATVLLLVGGIVLPVLGWFVGVALLWASEVFTTRDKLIGTFVLPGGLALPVFLGVLVGPSEDCVTRGGSGGAEVVTCSPGSGFGEVVGMILLALAILAPLATAIYLARKLNKSRLDGG
jgi:hypothetical protein